MVSEELGIPVERVRPSVGDTDSIGYTDVTGGSRVCYATGMAVIEAAQDVRDQLRGARREDLERRASTWSGGRAAARCRSKGDMAPLTLNELAAKIGHTGGPIIGRASVNAPMAGPGFSANICDIEVDKETGVSRVVRYTAIQDVGKAVHPSFVEGQMQGGAAQGIGWALNEEYVYSTAGRHAERRVPRLPHAGRLGSADDRHGHRRGRQSAASRTACAASARWPIVPPLAAVANAVRDATGIRFTELPLSPPRVLEALGRD